jgi:non-lysosomal glucosylceramidase
MVQSRDWPVLKHYDGDHLRRIALPLGGIGTGTVSLGGRGDLRDWEIMNRPAKGFIPRGSASPFFAIHVQPEEGTAVTRLLEGSLELDEYEGHSGSPAANHGLPRFREASFDAAYPLGQVRLSDPDVPVRVTLQAFNPLIPANAEDSGLPLAVLRFLVTNSTERLIQVSICGSLPNFIGMDGSRLEHDFANNAYVAGAKANRNHYMEGEGLTGILMKSEGVSPDNEAWGTLALSTPAQTGVTYRTSWNQKRGGWGSDLLSFWDDFSQDGQIEPVEQGGEDMPMGSLCVQTGLPAGETCAITFLLTWHFPHRVSWTPDEPCKDGCCAPGDRLINYYTVQYADAWDVAERVTQRLEDLETKTFSFVETFCASDLPEAVKEAALFNLSSLRSQTCFRTSDGRFYAWEGCGDHGGCCYGSCTHVWNYEQATAFLFGDLSRCMREIEFAQSTDPAGMMSFRVNLPIERAQKFSRAAADGQMGTILKVYRDWQLSGDDEMLRSLWPGVKRALAFCWIKGGWDGDRDGVMEGTQHNTMDVEYFGPNPQMEGWYLGALLAAASMAEYLGEPGFSQECRDLFACGSRWTDENLFNGEYYEHRVVPPASEAAIYPGLMVGMGAKNLSEPDYQLGPGCLVDQLVGQYMAHVCGLGYLLDPGHVRKTLASILKYNHRSQFNDHFNCMRSYVLGDEAALLMASYPHGRPANPFPYFSEVMTGFEYTAAVGMIYEGMEEEGIRCIQDIRSRYDGRKRSPFDEAECGHHYARAMASWAAVLALSGFYYSGVEKVMSFRPQVGRFFWSNGAAWGLCDIQMKEAAWRAEVQVRYGQLALRYFSLGDKQTDLAAVITLGPGRSLVFELPL